MKSLGGIVFLLIAVLAGDPENADWLHLGDKITIDEETRIPDLLEHPQKYLNRNVKISGIVASVCNEEGCFIEVVPRDGGGEGIVANFPGLTCTFPTDCTGLEAVVEGVFYQKIYPSARVSHWQHHSYRIGKEVPEYALIMRIAVKAAKIGGTRVTPPAPAEIRKAAPHWIDLGLMEFEDEGFGIGRKNLKPGAATPRLSTGGTRRMAVCLEGTVTVYKQGSKPVVLTAGQMAFIPPATFHEIRNEGNENAGYILIYARKIEKEKDADHDH